MPSYNPYLLQLPSVSRKAELIGYAIAVLSRHLAYNPRSSRDEIVNVLIGRGDTVEIDARLRDVVDDIVDEIRELGKKDIPRLLNDLRRLGIIDVYDEKDGVEERISPDESGWHRGYARSGLTMRPAASVLRRCLSSNADARFCLRLAAAVAAISFLYGTGGSSKLRMLVRRMLASRKGELDNVIKDYNLDRNKVKETLRFFEAALDVVRQAGERFPGLLPPGYLRVVEALIEG